jgi:hypothetical protein
MSSSRGGERDGRRTSGVLISIAGYWACIVGHKTILFRGQKFTVFQWQHEVLTRMLAPHEMVFDLPAWYLALDAQCLRDGCLVPQFDDTSRWLYEQTRDEAIRRGYAMAETERERFSPQSLRLRAAYRRVMQQKPKISS